jgi:hypothetical protein
MTPSYSVRAFGAIVMTSFALTTVLNSQANAQEVLTNDSVTRMVKAGLGESLIVDMIRTKPGKYSTTADDVIKLKRDGVSENEIAAMIGKGAASPGAPSGEQTPAHQEVSTEAQAPSKSAVPVTMTECEGNNDCATWTFLGKQGNGQWPSGEVANLSVERYDDESVVIRRGDSTGTSAGLTAVYTGTRHGDRLGGEFTSSWPGHWEHRTSNWYATIGGVAQRPPSLMRVCDPNYSCGTWTWNNGHYDGVWDGGGAGPNGSEGVIATMTVERFSPDSVIIHRTDSNRSGFSYVYTGKISSQGNSIPNGIWEGDTGSREAGKLGHFTATWGTALENNPAARVQRVVVAPTVVCYPWFFFTVVCSQ